MLSLGVEPAQLVNEDLLPELREVSQKLDSGRAGEWILQIEDLREQLIVNVNRKITTDSLFLVMAGDVAAILARLAGISWTNDKCPSRSMYNVPNKPFPHRAHKLHRGSSTNTYPDIDADKSSATRNRMVRMSRRCDNWTRTHFSRSERRVPWALSRVRPILRPQP